MNRMSNSQSKRRVLPIRIEKWVIEELEAEAEANAMTDSRSDLARVALRSLAKDLQDVKRGDS